METNRTDYCTQESGIALLSALLVTAICMLFIVGVYFLMGRGWNIALINKTYASAQEAAGGGAERASEVVRLVANPSTTPAMISNLGIQSISDMKDVVQLCDTTKTARIEGKTADGRYTIRVTLNCTGRAFIPGQGTPKFGYGAGAGSGVSMYFFYAINSEAKDVQNWNIARVESVYRYAQ